MITHLAIIALSFIAAKAQNSYIYGYDASSDSTSNGPLLVQNPNYQFLSGNLADDYSRTYQQQLLQYDPSASTGAESSGTMFSETNVPIEGYYTGPPMSNEQQNQINYQNIQQRKTNVASSNTNIYGYDYNPSSTMNTNNVQYSAPNTQQPDPYVYPFGQTSQTPSPTMRFLSPAYVPPVETTPKVQYDKPQVRTKPSDPTQTTFYDSNTNTQYYTLFDDPANAAPIYESASDLKTTRLRDSTLQPEVLPIRGAGPLPGPTVAELQSGQNRAFYDQRYASYPRARFSSLKRSIGSSNTQFFDVPGNETVMYYPYRTSSSFNLPPSSQYSQDQRIYYNPSSSQYTSNINPMPNPPPTTAEKCALPDPYWCQEYVQLFLTSRQTYDNIPLQQSCSALVQSLTESYNGCCTAVRAAGCPV